MTATMFRTLAALALLLVSACAEEGEPAGQQNAPTATLVCSEPTSDDDLDMGGDGCTPREGVCDDDDPAFHPNAPDVDDDRIDHNCDNRVPTTT